MTTRCAPVCSQALPVKPQGSGPEILKRERGHVTSEIWSFGCGGLHGRPA